MLYGHGWLGGAPVGVIGCPECLRVLLILLRRIAPVVLLLVRTGPLRTGVSRRAMLKAAGPPTRLLGWRRVPRMVCHVAAVLFLE